jgi:hypothetical protein
MSGLASSIAVFLFVSNSHPISNKPWSLSNCTGVTSIPGDEQVLSLGCVNGDGDPCNFILEQGTQSLRFHLQVSSSFRTRKITDSHAHSFADEIQII